ncbi:MAG: DUF4301 family protein [Candidatus Delongbacteria bacterium]|nr:DUF4301 family protein [Candidatus Delongbacteria bacterium]
MYKFNDTEIAQLNKRGISEETANGQLEILTKGAPYANITAPATIDNGINRVSDENKADYYDLYKKAKAAGRISKFVPASGAATRMFNDLIKASAKDYTDNALMTLKNIRSFPFFKDLENLFLYQNLDIDSMIENSNWEKIIEFILYDKGLNYADQPKAFLKFTQYDGYSRTALEEHIYEAISLSMDKGNHLKIHFTFSDKYIPKAMELIADYKDKLRSIILDVDFSVQKPSMDTLAVYSNNAPLKNENNELIFRPGGHGALIENLNDMDADIILIKNIDNIVNNEHRAVSDEYNKYLCGYLVGLETKIKYLLNNIQNCSQDCIEELKFISKRLLFINLDEQLSGKTESKKREFIFDFFNRPIRVCGMIKNTGEPGGGPFFVKNEKGISLQIVESSQIDMKDADKKSIFANSTHFNPVNIVCSLKDYNGNKFNLKKYIDKNSYFVANKTFDGKDIKALELPGLWNGAMSDWISAFVEMPLETFCPAKTVNDLLKKERFSKNIMRAN